MYTLIISLFCITSVDTYLYGKPWTCVVEWFACIVLGQIVSIPVQFVFWWIVIRRCGKFEAQDYEEWDDERILDGGVEPSLIQFMKNQVTTFLKIPFIENMILGMTLFLCFVIFSEMGMPLNFFKDPQTGEKSFLGQVYFGINYFLLTFFVIEIILKVFADTVGFISDFINIFDSIVVFISFGFQVANVDVSFVGLLRILRLIKVITEMKK